MGNERWIQSASLKKGTLSRQLGIPEHESIPTGLLNDIVKTPIGMRVPLPAGSIKVTRLLKRRATLAKTLRRL